MFLFYCPGINVQQIIQLPEHEMHHAVHVLRLKEGNEIQLTDGAGAIYLAEIIEISKKRCSIRVVSVEKKKKEFPFHLHIAIAPTKSSDRFDMFLEKSTETGISEITPLLCMNSERRKINADKENQTLISAMKQSGRSYLPVLNPLTSFNEFVSKQKNNLSKKFVAHCRKDEKLPLHTAYQSQTDVLVLIGPEGDFTKEEIELAIKNNFTPVSLGNYRLRTETAGIATCQTIHLISEIK